MARHLMIGILERTLRRTGSLVACPPGRRFDARLDGRRWVQT
jgi:hypothetical protein